MVIWHSQRTLTPFVNKSTSKPFARHIIPLPLCVPQLHGVGQHSSPYARSLKVSSTMDLSGAGTQQPLVPCFQVIGVSRKSNNMCCDCHRARDESLGKGDLSLTISSAWKSSPGVPSLQPPWKQAPNQLQCFLYVLFCFRCPPCRFFHSPNATVFANSGQHVN